MKDIKKHLDAEGGSYRLAIQNIVCHLDTCLSDEQKEAVNWHNGQSVSLAVMRLISNLSKSSQLASRSLETETPLSDQLTFDRFSAVNRERCESPTGFNHALTSWSTSDWFLAVIGELGEAANIAKKLNRVRDGIPGNKESAEVLREKLRREIGDSFVYLDLLAQSLGISVGGAAVEVFNAKSDEIGCPIRIAAPAAPSDGTPEEGHPLL